MACVNKVILLGYLGADAEVRQMNSGKPVMNFRMATTDRWKNSDGEYEERTEWTNVVTMNERTIDAISKYLTKGTQVYIEGKLQTRKWQDKEGQDRYSTEVMIGPNGNITLMGGKGDSEEKREPAKNARGGGATRPNGGSRYSRKDMDDEIPF
jgi:single-strand DNA-binding protein